MKVTPARSGEWLPLVERGEWNPRLRAAFASRSGAYAVRDKSTGTVLYVGESHCDRGMKTLQRHFQDASGKFAKRNEFTHRAPEKLEGAVWPTARGDAATKKQHALVKRLKPHHNRDDGKVRAAECSGDADFDFGANVRNPSTSPGYRATHGGERGPWDVRRVRVPDPRASDLVLMGEIVRIEYLTDKGDGPVTFFHDFGREHSDGRERGRVKSERRPLLAFNREGLVICGGEYVVRPEGIVG